MLFGSKFMWLFVFVLCTIRTNVKTVSPSQAPIVRILWVVSTQGPSIYNRTYDLYFLVSLVHLQVYFTALCARCLSVEHCALPLLCRWTNYIEARFTTMLLGATHCGGGWKDQVVQHVAM